MKLTSLYFDARALRALSIAPRNVDTFTTFTRQAQVRCLQHVGADVAGPTTTVSSTLCERHLLPPLPSPPQPQRRIAISE